jgi:CHAD domain-containing protein
LGKLTNDLRDLDVYLLAETDYRSMLPVFMQEDIAPLIDYLRSRRSDALAKVTAGLESEEYARTLKEWEIFLSEPVAADSATNASVPIIELARQRIYRQYRRIVRDGNRILEHTEDDLLHALRIECKKLRYLLEFFASLFPPKDMARMIRQLKRLQDNLGAFTDLSVQRDYLMSIAEALDISAPPPRRALVATGFLVETMARRQQEVKADFAETFKTFASPAHQKQFQRLFGTRKKAKS